MILEQLLVMRSDKFQIFFQKRKHEQKQDSLMRSELQGDKDEEQ